MAAVNTLPDLVVHKFFQFVPSKDAVRMMFVSKQWEGVWFLDPVLDFDEGIGRYNDDDQHERFIKFVNNTLERYSEFFDIHKRERPAACTNKRLRICMMRYLSRDATMVDKWLSLLLERRVKELDLSLSNIEGGGVGESSYSLSRMTLVNSKYLTSLNLEFLTLKTMDVDRSCARDLLYKKGMVDVSECLLPSLKRMSLKTVHELDDGAVCSLLLECPVIEYLSLISCCFQNSVNRLLHLYNSNLKMLEIEDCNYTDLWINNAANLETVRLVSSMLTRFSMFKCYNLKEVNIYASALGDLSIGGCHHSVAGTMDVPVLFHLLFHGYLTSKLSVKSIKTSYERMILLSDNWDGESDTFRGSQEHLQAMRDCLARLGNNSHEVMLFVNDFKDIMFQECLRATSSPPLPMASKLYVGMKNTPAEDRDINDLEDTLRWMAPLANIVREKHTHPSSMPYVNMDVWFE